MALTDEQKGAVITGASDTLSGLFNVLGKKQEVKAGQYASQAEMFKAIGEQKKAQAQEKTKKTLIVGGIILLVVVIIIVGIFLMKKNKSKK